MTPFKFGKKKTKESPDTTFSSPSSKQGSKAQQQSPQTSNISTSSNGTRTRDYSNQTPPTGASSASHGAKALGSTPGALRQGSQGSQGSLNSPQYLQQQQQQQNQQYNANYQGQQLQPQSYNHTQQQQYNQTHPQQQSTAIGYDQNNNMYNQKSPQRQHQQTPHQQYSRSPQHGSNGAPPPPRYAHPQVQQQPQQPTESSTPWARSKLLISPFPRYRHAASQFANDKGEVFVMGGLHNTSVYGDTWIIKPEADGKTFTTSQVDIYDNSPAPRVGHAATTCGNAFVVFGGDTVTNDEGEIDNDLYLFNMNSHTWTIPHPVGRKPSGRYGHSIGVIAITNFDSKIYLYGGQLDDTIYSDLCVFNLSSFRRPDVSWEWVTPADSVRPPPLTNHTMDVYDNHLWIFGGSNGKSLSNELWSYDPMSNKWDKHKTFGAIPSPCEEHASVIYKDCLIVSGGKDSYGEAIDQVSFLNLITKTWFRLPSDFTGTPKGKYGHSLSILKGDKLLALGGHLPDYSQLGDNLEPSMDDNGVGTLLNTLDLSNLEKIIPGFQQYRTPGNVRDQDRFQGPQSIFTPPQAQQQSPQKEIDTSPELYGKEIAPVAFDSNSTLAGSGVAQTAGTTPGSGTAEGHRGLEKTTSTSAEDVFQREREVEVLERQTPKKPIQRQKSLNDKTSPLLTRAGLNEQSIYPSAEEEELPLQIPSPVRSTSKNTIPAPLPKHDFDSSPTKGYVHPQASAVLASMPGSFKEDADIGQTHQKSVDDFQTPSTSPNKDPHTASLATTSIPAPLYAGNQKRDSDFLDNYVNGNSTPDLANPSQEGLDDLNISRELTQSTDLGNDFSNKPTSSAKSDITDYPIAAAATGKSAGVIGAGVAAVGAVGAVGAVAAAGIAGIAGIGSSVKKTPSPPLPSNEVPSPVGSTGVARSVSINRNVSAAGPGASNAENAEFQSVIAMLSKELENLKVSTNEQMKSVSTKVQSLESENQQLKQQLSEHEEVTRDLPEPEDESEIKRKHIKLNTDYQVLNQEHETVKSKHAELESIFSSNLFDLQRLNDIIKDQNLKLEEQQRELEESKTLKQQYDDLQYKYDSLAKEHEAYRDIGSKSFLESHEEVKKLNTGLDSFLAHYLVTDEATGETKARSIGGSAPGADGDVVTQLRSQIDELLKENEDVHTQKGVIEKDLISLKSTQSEVQALRAKVAELSKIEENYKESLHSVNTATRALQLSQSELAREKETTSNLEHELDELKLFRAKKSSRNSTPILSQQDDRSKADDDDEDAVANAHYNLKIRDLQAELYIIRKERDDLKEEALNLKKKLYNADNPSSSF